MIVYVVGRVPTMSFLISFLQGNEFTYNKVCLNGFFEYTPLNLKLISRRYEQ